MADRLELTSPGGDRPVPLFEKSLLVTVKIQPGKLSETEMHFLFHCVKGVKARVSGVSHVGLSMGIYLVLLLGCGSGLFPPDPSY